MSISPITLIIILFVGLGAALWILERNKPTGFEYQERATTGPWLLIIGIALSVAAAIAVSILIGMPI